MHGGRGRVRGGRGRVHGGRGRVHGRVHGSRGRVHYRVHVLLVMLLVYPAIFDKERSLASLLCCC